MTVAQPGVKTWPGTPNKPLPNISILADPIDRIGRVVEAGDATKPPTNFTSSPCGSSLIVGMGASLALVGRSLTVTAVRHSCDTVCDRLLDLRATLAAMFCVQYIGRYTRRHKPTQKREGGGLPGGRVPTFYPRPLLVRVSPNVGMSSVSQGLSCCGQWRHGSGCSSCILLGGRTFRLRPRYVLRPSLLRCWA